MKKQVLIGIMILLGVVGLVLVGGQGVWAASGEGGGGGGGGCSPGEICVELAEPLKEGEKKIVAKDGGTDLLKQYISLIYKYGVGIGGFAAVAVIVVSGLQIITAGGSGDTSGVSEAKDRILKALMGLVLILSIGLILYTINPTFYKKRDDVEVDSLDPKHLPEDRRGSDPSSIV